MPASSRKIAEILPYLRRYARALTGSQSRGDDYVRICLEMLLEDPERIDSSRVKVDLFAAFHDAWTVVRSTLPPAQDAEAAEEKHKVEQGVAALSPLKRQALLLVSLESFSYEDTAHILGITEEETRDLVVRAREEIRAQASAPVLIIEDEPMIAMELSNIVESMGHRVCGTAGREKSAVELAQRFKPGLVLADIQLKGGDSGIKAVHEILKNLTAPVIFITGFPERLLTGEALEPTYIVPKPFDPEMLKTVIGQALSHRPNDKPAAG